MMKGKVSLWRRGKTRKMKCVSNLANHSYSDAFFSQMYLLLSRNESRQSQCSAVSVEVT